MARWQTSAFSESSSCAESRTSTLQPALVSDRRVEEDVVGPELLRQEVLRDIRVPGQRETCTSARMAARGTP